jgi:predicted lactoylglutathione lyase
MVTNIFINLPVKDLEKTKTFFTQIGFKFNPQFTDEKAACLILGPNMFAMLLLEKYFITFTPKFLADTRTTAEVINALFVESRAEVDQIVDAALKAGATLYREPDVMDFMYSRSFQDLDGHLWEVGWMDPAHVEPM